jgi:hypothetical protein
VPRGAGSIAGAEGKMTVGYDELHQELENIRGRLAELRDSL